MTRLLATLLVACAGCAPAARQRPTTPPSTTPNPTTTKGPSMTPMLDESIDLETPALLAYLSARIDAPGGLLGSLRNATLVVRAKVTKMTVEGGQVAAQLAAAPELAGYLSDGYLMSTVVELDVTEDYLGGTARKIRLAFPQSLEVSAHRVILPPVGEDVVAIAQPPSTPLGRAVAEVVKQVIASDGPPVFMAPELGRELAWRRDAAAKPVATRIAAAIERLSATATQGRLAVPALEILLRASRAELVPVAPWLAGATGPANLLARAVLWHAGDHDAAAAGLDLATIPIDWIRQIGLSVAEADGDRLGILGPARTTPLL